MGEGEGGVGWIGAVGAGTCTSRLRLLHIRVSTFGGFGLEARMAGLASTSTVVGLFLPNTQNWLQCSHDWIQQIRRTTIFWEWRVRPYLYKYGKTQQVLLRVQLLVYLVVPRHSWWGFR